MYTENNIFHLQSTITLRVNGKPTKHKCMSIANCMER